MQMQDWIDGHRRVDASKKLLEAGAGQPGHAHRIVVSMRCIGMLGREPVDLVEHVQARAIVDAQLL